ncbi:hypothetical protein [Paragemmobacter straminiformis]|uniref:Response regulatory domain-containing protein n=1 Tax=Paragemmobacter straminiformis TaxID=2045119 RepID=A0A842I3R1_9RHOB|nr:hypothetical protein [Gemmobacter straminiformis]MBC2834792.1 hypothetical protein [Gemmobacter straminiformis]
MLTSAPRVPAPLSAAPACALSPAEAASLVAAVLSDRPDLFAEAARLAGITADCADAATFWLLPVNAPDILILDLPVAGITDRRLALLVRQLCRICPDLVIILADPQGTHAALPRDIELVPSPEALAEAFGEARHLLSPRTSLQPLFYHRPPKRMHLFR